MGAGFCPYCAAERWAITEALGRFGVWQGLVEDKSAGHDEKYLNIPTQSFAKATFSSDYIEFIGRETSDRNFEPLHELTESDYEVLDIYNPDQIIPFLLIDGQYVQVGSGFSPQLLQGLDHSSVKSQIRSTEPSVLGKAINQEVDNITALICKSIGNSAGSCSNKQIADILKEL
jgi:hypothetical protein